MTKLLSTREYPTRYRSAQDLILAAVQKESETMVKDYPRYLLPYDSSKPKMKFTKANIVAFAHDIIKSMLP